jgi:hypothetical protein
MKTGIVAAGNECTLTRLDLHGATLTKAATVHILPTFQEK